MIRIDVWWIWAVAQVYMDDGVQEMDGAKCGTAKNQAALSAYLPVRAVRICGTTVL
jgi:hypothetical protein